MRLRQAFSRMSVLDGGVPARLRRIRHSGGEGGGAALHRDVSPGSGDIRIVPPGPVAGAPRDEISQSIRVFSPSSMELSRPSRIAGPLSIAPSRCAMARSSCAFRVRGRAGSMSSAIRAALSHSRTRRAKFRDGSDKPPEARCGRLSDYSHHHQMGDAQWLVAADHARRGRCARALRRLRARPAALACSDCRRR